MSIGKTIAFVPDYEIKPERKLIDLRLAEYVPFGSDNLFPQATALFARSSPVHRGIINSKRTYVIGSGLSSEDEMLLDEFRNVNFEGESLRNVASKFYLDRYIGGNTYLEIISDMNKSFLWFNVIDYTKVRLSKEKDEVLVHPDWTAYRGRGDEDTVRIPLYPKFEAVPNEFGAYVMRSVVHVKDYEPEFYHYGVPLWVSGKDSVLIDLKTNKWNLSRLKNAFHVSGFLIVPVKDKTEGAAVLDYIEKEHKGEGNQAKLMVLTKSRAQDGEKADVTQFIAPKQQDDGSWEKLHEQATTDIIIAHGWFRALANLPDNTGFDTNRILNEYAVAKSTVIEDEQSVFIELVQKIYREQQGREIEFGFVNTPPVYDDSYKFIWEIRRDRGEEFDENDPRQQILITPNGHVTGNQA